MFAARRDTTEVTNSLKIRQDFEYKKDLAKSVHFERCYLEEEDEEKKRETDRSKVSTYRNIEKLIKVYSIRFSIENQRNNPLTVDAKAL